MTYPLTEEILHEYEIPSYMHGGLMRYVNNRIDPGGFLTAVISNDLMRAFEKADSINKGIIEKYARLMYNEFPSASYGSYECVKNWLSKRVT